MGPELLHIPGEVPVRGFLHRGAGADGLVLVHGAGSNCDAPLLKGVAEALSAAGLTVLRCDLPFRQARPHGPPSPAGAGRDRQGLQAALAALRPLVRGRLFLGGHSYGGRQATLAAADGTAQAGALLLLSYPLHPPHRGDQVRTAHFPDLRTPALFVHGARDPFGTLEEMRAALALIPARTHLVAIEGAAHDLRGAAARAAAAFVTFVA